MKQRLFPILVALLASVSACGFEPVYSPALSAGQSPIQVSEIPGRAGHELRQALLLETRSGLRGAATGGSMDVDLEETVLRTGFRSDGTAFRATLRLSARYVIDLGDGAISGEQSAETSFDVPDEPYADISAQNGAAQRMARELARKIVDDATLRLARAG